MEREKWYIRFLKLIGIIKEQPIDEEEMRSMCVRSIQAGICPHSCGTCAWGVVR